MLIFTPVIQTPEQRERLNALVWDQLKATGLLRCTHLSDAKLVMQMQELEYRIWLRAHGRGIV